MITIEARMKARLTITKFLETLSYIPGDISILIRGDHGIGKSQVMRQWSESLGLPLIDRRLSQTSEGDLIGLPTIDGRGTKFNPVDWYVQACAEPVVLFLDELNRASNEVMQAAFQIVLDRELNGHHLHPQTRVACAINSSEKYNVNSLDPALLDRFWVVDLSPSREEWLAQSRIEGVHSSITSFIAAAPKWLDPPEKPTGDDPTPSRRSWWRLSSALKSFSSLKESIDIVYNISAGFVGVEAAIAFIDHIKRWDSRIGPEEILTDPSRFVQTCSGWGMSQFNELIDSLTTHICSKEHITDTECIHVSTFMSLLPAELRISFWSRITSAGTSKVHIISALHKRCVDHLLSAFTAPPKGT
jgi:hypothetical protein